MQMRDPCHGGVQRRLLRAQAIHRQRLTVGLVLLCAAIVGGFQLARNQNPDGTYEPLKDAGGLVGGAIGAPLRAGLGTAGAAIVLIALGARGALLVGGTGVRQIAHAIASAARYVVDKIREYVDLPAPSDEHEGAPVANANAPTDEKPKKRAVLYDQYQEPADLDLVAAEAEAEDEYEEYDEDEEIRRGRRRGRRVCRRGIRGVRRRRRIRRGRRR
jgi:S-DNA-T family DNA segregation ATPase FtsK/SpoIIIE